jgi:hypothetical protein
LLVSDIPIILANEYTCIENWECTEFGVCKDGFQYRTCKETNGCKYIEHKPVTAIKCGYSLTEPVSCGNGIIDESETYLNCNKDIKLTPEQYIKCLKAGEDVCLYYQEYLSSGIFYSIIAIFILYYFWGKKK